MLVPPTILWTLVMIKSAIHGDLITNDHNSVRFLAAAVFPWARNFTLAPATQLLNWDILSLYVAGHSWRTAYGWSCYPCKNNVLKKISLWTLQTWYHWPWPVTTVSQTVTFRFSQKFQSYFLQEHCVNRLSLPTFPFSQASKFNAGAGYTRKLGYSWLGLSVSDSWDGHLYTSLGLIKRSRVPRC